MPPSRRSRMTAEAVTHHDDDADPFFFPAYLAQAYHTVLAPCFRNDYLFVSNYRRPGRGRG